MIDPTMVPDECWIALRNFIREHPYGYDYKEAICAALAAWPGAYRSDPALFGHKLIVPLAAGEDR